MTGLERRALAAMLLLIFTGVAAKMILPIIPTVFLSGVF